VPSNGLAYLPTASYTEMESWALPPEAALRLERLRRDLGEGRVAGPDGALVRGAHWRNFLVKYSESNRMHKKMQALSTLCRRRGNPEEARRALGRAQCNDAYWHGVFGGLYLPHLRDAVWRELALAEGALRRGKGLAWEVLDFDGDGHQEIWVHSESFSAIVSPVRGAAVEEYTLFRSGINYANVLTRRREAYHDLALERAAAHAGQGDGGAASIHDIEEGIRLDVRPPLDAEDRALLRERVLSGTLGLEEYERGEYRPVHSWARTAFDYAVQRRRGAIEIACAAGEGHDRLAKLIRFGGDGEMTVRYAWDPAASAPDDLFSTELSLAAPVEPETTPAAESWRYTIETIAKSERGLDRTRQGESLTLRWPIRLGEAALVFRPPA
jgi:alpha-amylase